MISYSPSIFSLLPLFFGRGCCGGTRALGAQIHDKRILSIGLSNLKAQERTKKLREGTQKEKELASLPLNALNGCKVTDICNARLKITPKNEIASVLQNILLDITQLSLVEGLYWIEQQSDFTNLQFIEPAVIAIQKDFSEFFNFCELKPEILINLSVEDKAHLLVHAFGRSDLYFAKILVEKFKFSATEEQEKRMSEDKFKAKVTKTKNNLMEAINCDFYEEIAKHLEDREVLTALPEGFKRSCVDRALHLGFVSAIKLLTEKGFILSEEQQKTHSHIETNLQRLREEREKSGEMKILAESIPKPLNSEHEKIYGNMTIFEKRYLEDVNFAKYYLTYQLNFTDPQIGALHLKELISILATRRRSTAELSGSRYSAAFGHPRKSQGQTLFGKFYSTYLKKWQELGEDRPKKISAKIGDLEINFLQISEAGWTHMRPTWMPEVFEYINMKAWCLLKANSSVSESEKIEEIGRIHWWFALAMPYEKGSGAIAEVYTHALWEMCHLPSFVRDRTINLDCEALIEQNCETYSHRYKKLRGL